MTLPVEHILPDLIAALRDKGQAVLQAPPGAGKTTRVPLYLLEQNLTDQKILMLEPRRVAARAAAERLAENIGEVTGQTVGYRIKGESKPGSRIEIVTEGILTRMIQSDPELSGIGCVIFDEFHERSLHADLGLALTLEIRAALRPDLNLIVMSATLDAAPVAALIDAPIITSEGQSYPVETIWLDQPWQKPNQRGPRFETIAVQLIEKAAKETDGGILVFLPGAGEIHHVQSALNLPDCEITPLYGAMPFKDQRRALAPSKTRKIVLATAIAETSLTIPDITTVVDTGRARRARFDPGSGMSRLITERVTKAEATQRRGRAGRVQSGTCYRMWTKGEEGGLAPFPPAEIESTDLTALVLELAQWGTTDPSDMAFLTQPPAKAFSEAQSLLRALKALDKNNRITDHGKALAKLPVHPRLGHMLMIGGSSAATLTALLENRDPVRGPSDINLRLEAIANPKNFERNRPFRVDHGAINQIRIEAKRLTKLVPKTENYSTAQLLSLAFPDRIGLRRKGDEPRYLLSGGKGAIIAPDDPLAVARMIVATDLDGDAREAKLRQGIAITEPEIRILHETVDIEICEWNARTRTVVARKRTMLDALVLGDQTWKNAPPEAIGEAMLIGIRDLGLQSLNWSKAARFLRSRVEWLHARGADMPDLSDRWLIENLEGWLQPFLGKCRSAGDLKKIELLAPLQSLLDYPAMERLNHLAPAAITAPTGTRLAVDYSGDTPSVAVRLQEMFGTTKHPTVGPDHIPLLIELLSPAQRPVQTTADLIGFWNSSYSDVRKDMRGRYPRHPWPEDPMAADPTRRVKRRR